MFICKMKGCNHLVQERNSLCTGCNSLWEAFINDQEEKGQVDNSCDEDLQYQLNTLKTSVNQIAVDLTDTQKRLIETQVEMRNTFNKQLTFGQVVKDALTELVARNEALCNRINELEKWQMENETTQLEKMERKS